MPSVFVTDKIYRAALFIFILASQPVFAQENTPWSRYGLGDPIHSSNILNRGMGNISIAYNNPQSVNFNNPASYSRFGAQKALLDLGIDFQTRTMQNQRKERASFSNVFIPYMAGGFQLKGEKRKREWGVAFGLKPISKVSYNIQSGIRKGADSITYNYEGNGGLYQAFAGTGIAFKNFSIGVNLGYRFGSKDYTTRVSMLNDTLSERYTSGQKEVRNNYGGLFAEFGIQYEINLSKKEMLTLGSFGSLSSSMMVRSEENIFTYLQPGASASITPIDSISALRKPSGNITYPSYFGFGYMYDRNAQSRLSIGADVSFQQWTQYRIYDQPDLLTDAWQIKAGVQWIPEVKTNAKKIKRTLIYRAGTYYNQEPYLFNGNVNSYGFTLGLGLPVKKYSYTEYNRNNMLNFALEFGRRGNATNVVTENYFRLAFGITFSDIWFIKSKYD
jgi:hypothetical protein